jgi:hypothetical protein
MMGKNLAGQGLVRIERASLNLMLTLLEGQRVWRVARYFRSYALAGDTHYWPGPDFGVGFGVGFVFFAGLDTPMLMSKKPNPLRSVSSRLMFLVPF